MRFGEVKMLRLFSVLAFAVLISWPNAGTAQDAKGDLADRLKAGGLVIYFRHGVTRPDEDSISRIDGCEGERNLTDAGREAMRAVKEAFDIIGAEISEVLSSPLCRVSESALIAFRKPEINELLASRGGDDFDDRRVQEILRLLSTPPKPATIRIVMAHNVNILMALGIRLVEGEAAILEPRADGRGEPTLIAQVRQEEWSEIAGASDKD